MSERILYNKLSADLRAKLDLIYQEALEIWKIPALKNFTEHGRPHIEQVEQNLDKLASTLNNTKYELKNVEIFILLAASCIHDIGMQIDHPFAREKHAQYTYDLIRKIPIEHGTYKVNLPIEDDNARRTIAEVARAHWIKFACALDKTDWLVGNVKGNLRLLGLLLAMADLLDLSPLRASHFRSKHQLSILEALQELHQWMYKMIRGYDIDTTRTGDLQLQIQWNSNSDLIHSLCDWKIYDSAAYMRKIIPELYANSGGELRWATPWYQVKYHKQEGEATDLSADAKSILFALRADQRRINREVFVERFNKSLINNDRVLFSFPKDSDMDGNAVSTWCQATAKLSQESFIANVQIQPSSPLDIASVVSQMMEQWGCHLPKCNDIEAIEQLKVFINNNTGATFFIIIGAEKYKPKLIEPIISTLFENNSSENSGATIVLLLTSESIRSINLNDVTTYKLDNRIISRKAIEDHLHSRLGYSSIESERIFNKLDSLGLAEKPGQIYTYIKTQCDLDIIQNTTVQNQSDIDREIV